jgi:hypothetical protein
MCNAGRICNVRLWMSNGDKQMFMQVPDNSTRPEGHVARRNGADRGTHAFTHERLRRWRNHLVVRALQVPGGIYIARRHAISSG